MRKGTWISDEIGSLPINSSAKIILAEIDNLHKSNGCKAGNSHFANILGVSTETVSRIISKLRKLGYVNQVHFDGRIRTLEPTFAITFAPQNVPSLQSSSLKSESNFKSIQPPQECQSRIDSSNKAAYSIQPNPLYNKKQHKENIKLSDKGRGIKLNHQKSFDKFLEWSRDKFSGSTREILLGFNSLDSLLKCENRTIQLAWENWK